MMGGGLGWGFHTGSGQQGLSDEDTFGKAYDQNVVARLWPYIVPYKRLCLLATFAMLVYVASQVSIPWLIKLGVDGYVAKNDTSGLTWVFVVFISAAGVNLFANYFQQAMMATVGEGVLYGLRRDMFAHLQKLSLNFYDKTEVGRIMSRVHGDTNQLQEFSFLMVMTLGDGLVLVGIVGALLIMNWQLALISMVVIPVLTAVMAVWQPFAKKAFIRVRRAIAIVNASLNENITGVRVVQSMSRQDRNLEIFDAKNREHYEGNLVAGRLAAGLVPPVDILTAVAIGLAIFFGGRMLDVGTPEVGALIAFIMYIQRFFDPIRNLTMSYTQMQRSMASGVRIFDLLDQVPDLVDAPDAKPIPKVKGDVEYRDLSFSYIPGEDVLRNVNLHITPGETVAVVGPTGAGKTTLVSLLARFYEVERGRGAILVDGYDIRDVTRHSLASQMSMVLQEPYLFSGTVKENIKYNHEAVSDEKMVEAAKAVGADNFVMLLEDGYDTYLQERGVNLSVGQRQLLSFARAIVADPQILILDEATANIDSYTELLIQRALQKLLKGRTAIVIAHRLSTIRGADKIVVFHLGEVMEVGTHQQLMDRDGLYAHLYRMNYAAIEEPLPIAGDGNGNDA